jgi:hypothetical protein
MGEIRSLNTIMTDVVSAVNAGHFDRALTLIDEGKAAYPGTDKIDWSRITLVILARRDAQADMAQTAASDAQDATPEADAPVIQAAAPKRTRTPRKAAASKATDAPAPVAATEVPAQAVTTDESAETLTITIRHRVGESTHLIGTVGGETGARISAIMGRNGLKWTYWPQRAMWYVRGSKDGGADMTTVEAARTALSDAGFTVALDIDSTDPATGQQVEPNVSKATAGRRESVPVERKPRVTRKVARPAGNPGELLARLLAGDPDVIKAVRAAIGDPSAQPAPVRKPRAAAVVSAGTVDATPYVYTVRLADGAHVKHTATAARMALYAGVTNVFRSAGVEIHVFADKTARTLQVTASMAALSAEERSTIVNKVIETTGAVEGVKLLAGSAV